MVIGRGCDPLALQRMAQDLTASGADLAGIMQVGRWKSERMPARYGEKVAAGRNAVARYYERTS